MVVFFALGGLLVLLLGTWVLKPLYVGTFLASAAGILAARVIVLRRAVDATHAYFVNRSPNRIMRFTVTETEITVEFENTSDRYTWKGMRRLWRYPDVWLIEIVRMRSILYPVQAAPSEMSDLVVEACRRAGIRV